MDLPVDAVLPDFVRALKEARAAVLIAPPGAGKTTRVPSAVLDAGAAGGGDVIVVQPRRLAARMAAARVAAERGEAVGQSVGYEVRFDRKVGAATKIRFVTEGVLSRKLVSDPQLSGVGAVILDEFHERHLATDIALARLRALQRGGRPKLRLAVMSATMDPTQVAAYLGDCPILESRGERFPVSIDYEPERAELPLPRQVSAALRRLLRDGLNGHVLVFLPGAAEIRRAAEACADVAARNDLEIAALHGDLPPERQDRAVAPSARRKVVLATNVAETSITIDGIEAVIDSGLARAAVHSPWSGIPSTRVAPISQASAAQRAGRAGRTGPGRCVRLYSRGDHDARRPFDRPEVMRADLAEAALELHAAGVENLASFPFFEAPPPAALAAAEELLSLLGAIDARGQLTGVGRRMIRFPLHPRLSRILVEAEARGVGEDGCVLAALASQRPLRLERRGGGAGPHSSGPSDLLEDLEVFRAARQAGLRPERLRAEGLDVATARSVDRASRQLERTLADADRRRMAENLDGHERDRELQIATLAGYPDRLARRRRAGGRELAVAGGVTATLSATSAVLDAELMVAVDVETRGPGGAAVVRSASAVDPDWILELFLDRVEETDELEFSYATERVERVRRLSLGGFVFDEERDWAAARRRPEAAAEILAHAALAGGIDRFVDREALDRWRCRVTFAAEHAGDPALRPPDDDAVAAALADHCAGLTSFAELERMPVLEAVRAALPPAQRRLVDELAPETVSVPGRRRVPVHYEWDRPPWIASRLQDFFGLSEGPRVANGRVLLVLHLLAPNRRAVQVTEDLAGFWDRHYPELRRRLSRRYPRHAWPEHPLRGG